MKGTDLVIDSPMLQIINNKAVHHIVLTGCVVHACAVLNGSILVKPKIITWHNL